MLGESAVERRCLRAWVTDIMAFNTRLYDAMERDKITEAEITGYLNGTFGNPADLVGAVVASDYSSQWYGDTGQPVMAFQALAIVVGYADGVFECVLLSVTFAAGHVAMAFSTDQLSITLT